jgi:regulator of RNase E activity RraB
MGVSSVESGDALRVLINHVAPDSLNPAEKAAIDALRLQLDEVDREKARR